LEEGADEHDAVEAVEASQDGDEGGDEHGDGEVEAADEGVVPW
jgi:hypothetical protein